MIDYLHGRVLTVWALLAVATAISLGLGTSHVSSLATVAALTIAFVKARIVGLEFMELRHAPPLLRGAFETWLVLIGSSVIGLFAFA
jgi:caa(3)-type oxidase subunit IV